MAAVLRLAAELVRWGQNPQSLNEVFGCVFPALLSSLEGQN